MSWRKYDSSRDEWFRWYALCRMGVGPDLTKRRGNAMFMSRVERQERREDENVEGSKCRKETRMDKAG